MDELETIRHLFQKTLPMFSALGDKTRQQLMILMIEPHPKTVQQLAEHLELSRPAVSHHLKILKSAGLIEEVRAGTKRFYHPIPGDYINDIQQLLNEIDQLPTKAKGTK